MKYEITEQQKNQILILLGKIPAKYSFDLIVFFKSLKAVEEKKASKSEHSSTHCDS